MKSPIQERNTLDPGDETGRNFRYQYGYGVILLVAAALKDKDYQAIWCEQQEDFLCEIKGGGRFDAVQVKTQQPESGYWQTNDPAFTHSIKRFVELDTKYPGVIRRFAFVSNTKFLDSDASTQASKSPLHLLDALGGVKDWSELPEKPRKAFHQLAKDIGASEQALFSVLNRLDLTLGPSRDSFVAEIAQNHLSLLPVCKGLTAAQAGEVAETVINLVERASALACQAPERHYACLNRNGRHDPQLRAKRLSLEEFLRIARSEKQEHTRSKSSAWWCLIAGPLVYLTAFAVLPRLQWEHALEQPVLLGEVSHVNVAYYIGDVAIPNRLKPTDTSGSTFELDSRHKYWDAYLITAPVPQVLQTTQGVVLTVPWTLLPRSVCESVRQLDPICASELEDWLKLKNSPAEWHFDRLLRQPISPTNHYYRATGVEAIYAVNLFDFLNELGNDYRGSLGRAISSATKEVVERAGNDNQRKVAIPALAAAEHVSDRHIVLSYAESFSASLDGIRRTEGRKPAEIVLVIWRAWLNTPELQAAVGGLERACFLNVESWRRRLVVFALIGVLCSFCFGLAVNYAGRKPKQWPVTECVAALILISVFVLGHESLAALLQNCCEGRDLGLNTAIVSQVLALAGYYMHEGIYWWKIVWERRNA